MRIQGLKELMAILAALVVVLGGVLGGVKWIVSHEIMPLQSQMTALAKQINDMEEADREALSGIAELKASYDKIPIEEIYYNLEQIAAAREDTQNQLKELIEHLKSSGLIPDNFGSN